MSDLELMKVARHLTCKALNDDVLYLHQVKVCQIFKKRFNIRFFKTIFLAQHNFFKIGYIVCCTIRKCFLR